MPQMNKGGKFIFGKSLIRTDGTLRIPSAMKRKNVTCVKELFNCIALMSVTSFVGLEKMFLILHLKMRKVFLLPNVWKEGLLKLTITIGLQ